MASVQITHICFERDKELANETRISLHSVFILMHCEIPGKVCHFGGKILFCGSARTMYIHHTVVLEADFVYGGGDVSSWWGVGGTMVVVGEVSSATYTANSLIFLPPFLCGYYVQRSDNTAAAQSTQLLTHISFKCTNQTICIWTNASQWTKPDIKLSISMNP